MKDNVKTIKFPNAQQKMSVDGTSGIDYSGHRFYEEYLTKLLGTYGPEIYDEMRRSDDQVIMLLRVVKNPIMSARWFVSPADDSDESKKIADFISFAVFDDMGTEDQPKTFEKFKREALTSIEFGYSLFEITNKVVLNSEKWGSYIGLKGLDWRSPKTIEEWYIDRSGELEKVRQIDNSQVNGDIYMDGKFLLHIASEMEGINYEGISMLRPIYGNWLRKDVLRKLQMIGIERAATGVPIGEIPRGQENGPGQTALEDSLSRFTGHERQYLTIPEGFKVDSLKIDHDAEKVQKAIEAENIGMSKSFLANFMELGLNGSGSFALGSDLSDIFLSGIVVYANAVKIPFNTKLIPHLVKANFGKQKAYPKLEIEGINDKAGKELAEVLKSLKEGGFLQQITKRMQEVIHQRYDLPFDNTLEIEEPEVKEPVTMEPVQAVELSEIEFNLAEKSVGKNILMVGDELTKLMQDNLRPRAKKLVSLMLTIWKTAPKSKRMSSVNALIVPSKNEYKKLISTALSGVYVQATNGVKNELSISGMKLAEPTKEEIKALPADSKATGKSQAELIVDSQDADLRKALFFSFTATADTLPTEVQMEANLLNVVERYLTGPSIRTAGPNAIAAATNLARNAVFQKKEVLEGIESFVFTNPSPEAPICMELAGRVFTKEEYILTDKLPPLHHNCNSWIVAQLSGDKKNKPISPAGLTVQGTAEEIEKINKSIKF